MDFARGLGYQAVCEVLEQHTKQDTRTEPTEVSQQLWTIVVVILVATTMPQKFNCEEGLLSQHTLIYIHVCTHGCVPRISLSYIKL